MANSNPVNSWDMTVLLRSEAVFGTPLAPLVGNAIEAVTCTLGPSANTGNVRPKKDRPLGRGMQNAFIEGDVDPFPFVLEYSQKSRSAIDVTSLDSTILFGAGMTETLNGATSAVYTVGATPIESGAYVPFTTYRYLGKGSALHQMERLQGCVVKGMEWSGGDKELTVKATGEGIRKSHWGRIDSVTLASGATTTFTPSALDARKNDNGGVAAYMQIESEIVTLSMDYTAPLATITRGELLSSAVAHTAKPLYPYMPPSIAYTGSPLSEANASVILGGFSPLRTISFTAEWTTGMDLQVAETSSKYRQGVKSVRSDMKIKLRVAIKADDVALLGYAANRDTVSCTLSQGSGTGGIWSLTAPYCEVAAFSVPDTAGDVAIVDIELRCRENGSGNNMFSITLT